MTRDEAEDLAALGAFLRENGVTHFSAREVCPVGREAGNSVLRMAPRTIWPNIVPTLLVLQDLREHFRRPVIVLSGYRSPAYNAAIAGERASLHLSFNAIDFRCGEYAPEVLARWLDRHEQSAKLGVGTYQWGVHIDTRGTLARPAPARWRQ